MLGRRVWVGSYRQVGVVDALVLQTTLRNTHVWMHVFGTHPDGSPPAAETCREHHIEHLSADGWWCIYSLPRSLSRSTPSMIGAGTVNGFGMAPSSTWNNPFNPFRPACYTFPGMIQGGRKHQGRSLLQRLHGTYSIVAADLRDPYVYVNGSHTPIPWVNNPRVVVRNALTLLGKIIDYAWHHELRLPARLPAEEESVPCEPEYIPNTNRKNFFMTY